MLKRVGILSITIRISLAGTLSGVSEGNELKSLNVSIPSRAPGERPSGKGF
jgi:hypothetical protein